LLYRSKLYAIIMIELCKNYSNKIVKIMRK